VRVGINTVVNNATDGANLINPFTFECRLHHFEIGDVFILVFCIHLHARHWDIPFEETKQVTFRAQRTLTKRDDEIKINEP
jgi:hypothetical protein